MNQAMMNPDNLLGDNINILDKRGRDIGLIDLRTAKKLVESKAYYIITSGDIVLK
ncbi:MAG: hypothetical protein PVG39_00045 [Desulfobacteraceae bacterium]|jgi:hypothetical protein